MSRLYSFKLLNENLGKGLIKKSYPDFVPDMTSDW